MKTKTSFCPLLSLVNSTLKNSSSVLWELPLLLQRALLAALKSHVLVYGTESQRSWQAGREGIVLDKLQKWSPRKASCKGASWLWWLKDDFTPLSFFASPFISSVKFCPEVLHWLLSGIKYKARFNLFRKTTQSNLILLETLSIVSCSWWQGQM